MTDDNDAFVDISIAGIDRDNVGVPPVGDGLYRVALNLSAVPSVEWSRLFVLNWDSPKESTTMHRPHTARVWGSRIVLRRTSMEELERVHLKTLRTVLAATNKQYRELLTKQQQDAAIEEARIEEHSRQVAEIADRLDPPGDQRE